MSDTIKPTVVCSGLPGAPCGRVITVGSLGAPLSHGIGPCCWAPYRAAYGLAPRPYPGSVVAVAA